MRDLDRLETIRRFHAYAAAAFLTTTGALKLLGMFYPPPGAHGSLEVDPLLGLPNSILVPSIALFEIFVASILARRPSWILSLMIQTSLLSTFMLYRIFMRVLDIDNPCKCTGDFLATLFPGSEAARDYAAFGVTMLLYAFFFSSVLLLGMSLKRGGKSL